jgi:photosystem II stability/assembly factor-like uncharacterized protein
MKTVLGRALKLVVAAMPFFIIIGLFGAALFIKPKAVGKTIQPPTIERRDRFYGIVVPEQNVIWAAGSGGKIVRSDDGGNTWSSQNTKVSLHLQDIAAWDAQQAVTVGNQGVVIITRDGGKTWDEVQAPKSSVANKLVRVKAYSDGSAWAVGEMGAVLVSRDHGASWTRSSKEEDVGWNDIAFIDPKNGWVVGEFGRMLHTTNGGAMWQPVKGPVQSSLTAVAFRDAANGVAVGMEGMVLTTADGGRSWKEAKKVTKVHLFDVTWTGDSWRVVGGKGVTLTADKAASKWTAARLSENDLAWHTRAVTRFGSTYICGGTTGVLSNGTWNVLKAS